MIAPVTNTSHNANEFKPTIGDELKLIKVVDDKISSMKIEVFYKQQRIGFLSTRSLSSQKVLEIMESGDAYGIVWALFPYNILVELEPQNIRLLTNGD